MKSRFQPDEEIRPRPMHTPSVPERFDVGGPQFAASLDEKSTQTQFNLEGAEPPLDAPDACRLSQDEACSTGHSEDRVKAEASEPASQTDSWRSVVAARVNHYRGKRPRAPRYPSLLLKFEPPEPSSADQLPTEPPLAASHGQLAITMDPDLQRDLKTEQAPVDVPAVQPETHAKILEFPRSSFAPPAFVEELAEPVFEQPRILEVPEFLPPPPALGGILIESSKEDHDERRPGFELPLNSASLARRILAGVTDALLVATAFASFAYIFFRITSILLPPLQLATVSAVLLGVFWAAYQYILLVYAGNTPGLKIAGLQLSRFDGSSVPRPLRRWRVIASVLSGLSLALGYAWCFLDEDKLCWHDRITHTYMAPKREKLQLPSDDE